jgi:hypothetical protein
MAKLLANLSANRVTCVGLIIAAVLLGPASVSGADGWVRVKAGTAFSFSAPETLKAGPRRGIDSFVGAYDSEHFGLWFDYGQFSGHRFTDKDANDLRFIAPAKIEEVSIDGRQGWVMTGQHDGASNCEFEVALAVESVRPGINLSMTSCGDQGSVEVVHAIYKSIRFEP